MVSRTIADTVIQFVSASWKWQQHDFYSQGMVIE